MWLKQLSLLNFKNYSDAEISFSDTVNAFVGLNGSGKTNLLDAIHYLCLCKSYFNPIDIQQIKIGEDIFLIQGNFEKNNQLEQISCGLKRNQKKQFKRNKKEYEKLADHIGQFPLVMISPYDINLVMDGSEDRRKFMDSVISQTNPNYLDTLITYNKHLSNRNAFLKKISESRHLDLDLLEIYNDQLVESGLKIFEVRKAFMLEFIPLFNQYYTYLSGEQELVDLKFQSQLFEADFSSQLVQSLSKDRALERTTVGIHKDELNFTIHGMSLKKFGSQGQQKSFLIALKLAQYKYFVEKKGFKPLLLLDDIFDKLDDLRIEKLMSMVSHHDFGQIFITDTSMDRIKAIFDKIKVDIKIFVVEKGEVSYA
ncbi:DNA replication/repair protein RecF [Pedobacter flavus]|uniref:DNA replication and repair protein RecF n=1 Tax=Pedobacter flavus TaxID=3113906 RepID=A0ABU7GYF7_9SPHI|nr:DNA replication and repair protein RecF [Pedobacter sp. VNH31]MEE1884052.1 DNA replication and repair protein RecF [Pedobacter sp. VNH31]